MRATIFALVVAVAATTTTTTARAADNRERARQLFKEAMQHYDRAEYSAR